MTKMTTNLTEQYKELERRFGPQIANQMLFKSSGPQGAAKAALTKWQRLLHLDDWNVTLEFKDIPELEQSCDARTSEKRATITLMSKLPTDEIEHTVAHELFHCILWAENDEFDQFLDDMEMRKAIDKDERKSLEARYNLSQNKVIEHLLPTLGLKL